METRKQQFLVNFVTTDGNLKVLSSTQPKYDGIVLGKANQFFTINVTARDPEKPYAAKLFIDDQEVVTCKTFKKRGNFFGFRKGNGNYDRFVFSIPDPKTIAAIEDQELKQKGKIMGEIRIAFFNAEEVWRRVPPAGNRPQEKERGQQDPSNKEYRMIPAGDCKNLQSRSLSVGCGPTFQISLPKNFAPGEKSGPHKDMVLSTRANFDDGPIDLIVLRYSNVSTLIGQGTLDPLNLDHLNKFPLDFVKGNNLVLEAFYQALSSDKKSSKEIQNILEKTFGQPLGNLIEGGIATLSKAHQKRSPPLTQDNLKSAVISGEFTRFCSEPKATVQASEKEERKFLGKRDGPVRQQPRPNKKDY